MIFYLDSQNRPKNVQSIFLSNNSNLKILFYLKEVEPFKRNGELPVWKCASSNFFFFFCKNLSQLSDFHFLIYFEKKVFFFWWTDFWKSHEILNFRGV